MNYLVFDTETSNFPQPSLAVDHPNQGRIIQLAWLLVDSEFNELACFSGLVKICGKFKISDGAMAAHGITHEMCDKYGMDITTIMQLFTEAAASAQCMVAHNIKFDRQLVDIELRAGQYPLTVDFTKSFCTMEAMTPLCKLPSKRGGCKWPKLIEAHQFCFNEEFEGAHNALADVRATARILQWLITNGHKV